MLKTWKGPAAQRSLHQFLQSLPQNITKTMSADSHSATNSSPTSSPRDPTGTPSTNETTPHIVPSTESDTSQYLKEYEDFLNGLHRDINDYQSGKRMDPTLIAQHCNLTAEMKNLDHDVSTNTTQFFNSEHSFLNVTKIDLQGMKIKEIRCLDLFTNLTHLNLQNNLITEIPLDQFEFLHELRFLSLGDNNLQRLQHLYTLENLYFLDVAGNRIEYVEEEEENVSTQQDAEEPIEQGNENAGENPDSPLPQQESKMEAYIRSSFPPNLRICNIEHNPFDTEDIRESMIKCLPYLMSLNDELISPEHREQKEYTIGMDYEREFEEVREAFANDSEKPGKQANHEEAVDSNSNQDEASLPNSNLKEETKISLQSTQDYLKKMDSILSKNQKKRISGEGTPRDTSHREELSQKLSKRRSRIIEEHQNQMQSVSTGAQSTILKSLEAKMKASQERLRKMHEANVRNKVSKPISLSRHSSLSGSMTSRSLSDANNSDNDYITAPDASKPSLRKRRELPPIESNRGSRSSSRASSASSSSNI